MGKAYLKDCRKMFKNNLFRYISIILIIMLGAIFFVGMNSVSPEMKRTAEEHMENNNIFDISLVSNLGYKKEDIDKFKENEHVTEVQGVYSQDVLVKFGEKDLATRLSSIPKNSNMNQDNIIKGKSPKNNNECLICSRLVDMYDYNVGDKIKVYLQDDTNLEDYINVTEFEIVGVTKNPMYLSKFYGNTSLLTGELNAFIMVNEEVFEMEDYTTVYIKTDIDNNLDKFSEEYKEKLEEILPSIEKINTEVANSKFEKIYKESEDEIVDKEKQVNSVEQLLKNADVQIKDYQLQINDGVLQIGGALTEMQISSTKDYTKALDKKKNIAKLYNEIDEKNKKVEEIENTYSEKKEKKDLYQNEMDTLEDDINKMLYEIYSLDDEEIRFVELSKEVNNKYYEYNKKNEEFKVIEEEYNNKKTEIENINKEIKIIEESIEKEQKELYDYFYSIKNKAEKTKSEKLISAVKQIEDGKSKIEEFQKKLVEQDVYKKIEDAKKQIEDNRKELNGFKIVTQETPLYKSSGFKSLKEDLSKIAIMGRIFPVMFFVVAALVTTTTITRMIEEDRKNIGTLKALGYSKKSILFRYIIYSLSAAILGTLFGSLIGSTLIVKILFVSYGSLYDLPDLFIHINWIFVGIAFIIALLATVFVTVVITLKALKENTAELMRPKTAKEGKNIVLEKMPIVWNRFDFLYKICFRNIFRYKRRLFMTLVGIAGCTALIYSGLGLQSSINTIGEKQFKDIRKLSMEVYLQKEMSEDELEEIENQIKSQKGVVELTPVSQQTLTVEANDNSKDVFYIALSGENASHYMGLQERKTQEEIKLSDDGIIITEKLAGILEVKEGDKILVKDDDVSANIKVSGITENYLYNYIYMTPKMYERIYGKEIEYNEFFINIEDNLSEEDELELSNKIKENDKIAGSVLTKNLNEEFQTSLASLMSIVFLFVGCASLLAFIVLINLNNINFEERKRELSTIKLLGFYQRELESYLFRENIILTIFGTIVGLFLGMGIFGTIIQSAEVETIYLAKDINYINLGISAVMTLAFTLITNMFMKRKVKNIDMIESLKSVE